MCCQADKSPSRLRVILGLRCAVLLSAQHPETGVVTEHLLATGAHRLVDCAFSTEAASRAPPTRLNRSVIGPCRVAQFRAGGQYTVSRRGGRVRPLRTQRRCRRGPRPQVHGPTDSFTDISRSTAFPGWPQVPQYLRLAGSRSMRFRGVTVLGRLNPAGYPYAVHNRRDTRLRGNQLPRSDETAGLAELGKVGG